MDLEILYKTLIGLFVSSIIAILLSKLRGRKLRLPPGPFPVPIFGNWLQVGNDLNHRNLSDLSRRFGEVLLLRMGQRNLIVVSSADLAREVLHTQGVEFGSREARNVVINIFTGKGQDMVFTVYGDHWRKIRRITTVPFFTNKAIETTLWSIEWGIAELVNHPDVLQKLRHELDTVLGKGVQITEPDTHRLPYLQAVIKETLLLRMAIPLLLPHMNLHDAKLNGYDIPAGR
ncbi:Trans-cinnamate 4-monooxygenase [Acorus gramineus]|uniref:trans-cinnamate 4-monooxygenase n=1 Tax=Acorus gramineus TaxID=55184 RepID=A0AAV9AVC1_ACOGR|nr:Trans-cinnamate 4-monooxygenase [Acorus gramineus]